MLSARVMMACVRRRRPVHTQRHCLVTMVVVVLFGGMAVPCVSGDTGPAEALRMTLCARRVGAGSIEVVYRESPGARRIVAAADISTGAWYLIFEGKVFGQDGRGKPFEGRSRAGGVLPMLSTPRTHTIAAVELYLPDFIGHYLCDHPELLRSGRITTGDQYLWEASLPQGSLRPVMPAPGEVAFHQTRRFVFDTDGLLRRMEVEGSPHAYRFERFTDPVTRRPIGVFAGFGNYELVSCRVDPGGNPAWFSAQAVERRAVALDTAGDADPRHQGIPVSEAILRAPMSLKGSDGSAFGLLGWILAGSGGLMIGTAIFMVVRRRASG